MREKAVDKFFEEYALRFNRILTDNSDLVDEVIACFAEHFIEANPLGVQCGANDEKFRDMIPKGYQKYRDLGVTSMEILSKDITLLNEFHSSARIKWTCKYKRPKDSKTGSIDFEVIYFLQEKNGSIRIFAYITGDEQKAFEEHGLL